MESFVCSSCRTRRPADVFELFCPRCGEPMLIAPAPKARAFRTAEPMGTARYLDFLPLRAFDPRLSLGEGGSPLQPLTRLAKAFRLPPVFAKNEAVNPTASFKDRGSVVAMHRAKALGLDTVGTISTGNMAGSTAAYAARAGLRSIVFVKEDTTREKVLAAGIYGALVVKVRGDYASLFRKSFEIGRARRVWFMNSIDPYRIEGYKVTSYEIFEQLGGRAPDRVFVPVSAGGHLIGLLRAFHDLAEAGLSPKVPFFVGVQAAGCAPVARAFARGRDEVLPFPHPRTVAHAISNPNPPGGRMALRLLRESGGTMTAVGEAEILRAQALLAEYEGIFCDPASATVLAAFLKMARRGLVPLRSRTVLIVTGSGLKTVEDIDPSRLRLFEADLDGLESTLDAI